MERIRKEDEVTAPADDLGPSLTISEFCRLESISTPTYHKIQRQGLGPETYCIPGTRVVRISAKARKAWQAKMAALSATKQAKLESKRREDQAARAGKLAAQSPAHHSKRKEKAA